MPKGPKKYQDRIELGDRIARSLQRYYANLAHAALSHEDQEWISRVWNPAFKALRIDPDRAFEILVVRGEPSKLTVALGVQPLARHITNHSDYQAYLAALGFAADAITVRVAGRKGGQRSTGARETTLLRADIVAALVELYLPRYSSFAKMHKHLTHASRRQEISPDVRDLSCKTWQRLYQIHKDRKTVPDSLASAAQQSWDN